MKKKRIIASILGLALVAGAVGTLTSCGESSGGGDTPEVVVTLSSISVTASGETVEKGATYTRSANVKVTATYSDNSTKDVTANATFSSVDTSTAGTKTVTVTYEGKTATYTVTVTETAATLLAIEVVTEGKTSFVFGDAFTTEGLTLQGTYDDGTTAAVSTDNVNITVRSQDSATSTEVTSAQFAAVTTKTIYYVYIVSKDSSDIYTRYAVTIDEAKTAIVNSFDASTAPATMKEDTVWGTLATGSKATIKATSEKTVTANSNKKTFHTTAFGDISTTYRIDLGGAAETATATDPTQFAYRTIVLELENDATVGIGALSSNKSENRTLKISNGSTLTKPFIVDGEISTEDKDENFFTVDLEAGTYYIYCGVSDEAAGTKAGKIYINTLVVSEKVSESEITTTGIAVDTTDAKTSYTLNDSFDTTGLKITRTTNYGEVALDASRVTFTSPALTDGKFTTAGTATVTATFGTFTATFNVGVAAADAVLSSIEITTVPTTSYVAGNALDLSAMVLTAKTHSASLNQDFVLADDLKATSEGVTAKVYNGDTEVTDFTTLTKGVYTLKVTYTVGEVTVETTTNIKVFESTGVAAGSVAIAKTEYVVGDTASAAGAEICQGYSDGVEADNYTKTSSSDVTIAVYSDQACTTAVSGAFTTAGTYYYKVVKGSLVSTETFQITVRAADSAIATWTAPGSDIAEGTEFLKVENVITVKATAGKLGNGTAASTGNCNKMDSNRVVTYTNTSTGSIDVVITLNASGSDKKFKYSTDGGTTYTEVTYDKLASSPYTFTITLTAGQVLTTTTGDGGIQLISINVYTA